MTCYLFSTNDITDFKFWLVSFNWLKGVKVEILSCQNTSVLGKNSYGLSFRKSAVWNVTTCAPRVEPSRNLLQNCLLNLIMYKNIVLLLFRLYNGVITSLKSWIEETRSKMALKASTATFQKLLIYRQLEPLVRISVYSNGVFLTNRHYESTC